VKQLKHEDGVFKDDSLLAPVIPDDPLLRKRSRKAELTPELDFDDDDWTDDGVAGPSTQALDRELEAARKQIAHLQSLVQAAIAPDEEARVKGKGKVGRDDDTHYFDSYAENGVCVTLRG
jgi:protein arginine N-methyltransferase 3